MKTKTTKQKDKNEMITDIVVDEERTESEFALQMETERQQTMIATVGTVIVFAMICFTICVCVLFR